MPAGVVPGGGPSNGEASPSLQRGVGTAAGENEPARGSPPGKLVSAFEDAAMADMGSKLELFDLGRRAAGEAQPAHPGSGPGVLSLEEPPAAPMPRTLREQLANWRSSAAYIWWGLPTACKATMIVAVVNFVLSLVYAGVSLMLPDQDEEIHITVSIVISAVFVLYTVADAVVYENTLELATSVVLDTLVLGRVIWFAAQRSSNMAFKIAWCTAMVACQLVYICVTILAWREFGWRLYGKLGVDFREKGAAKKMRMALTRNAYVTVLKINVMLLVVLAAIGIDVSVEKRKGNVYVPMLVVSICALFVGGGVTWLAARIVQQPKKASRKLVWCFDASMPALLGQPVALIILFNVGPEDMANANISLNVSGGATIVTSLVVWWGTHWILRAATRAADDPTGETLLSGRGSVLSAGDPVLAAMHAGAWLGKPTQRNPNKIRFFQLSHDGSTLRWGWNKFVRLYYVEEMYHSDADRTLTLTFPFEEELVLKCLDVNTYFAWRRGLAHLLLLVMAPGTAQSGTNLGRAGSAGSHADRAGSGPLEMARTASKGLVDAAGAAADAAVRAEEGTGGEGGEEARASPALALRTDGPPGLAEMRSLSLLRLLGVRVQEIGRRVAPRRWSASQQGPPSQLRTPRRSAEGEWTDDESVRLSGGWPRASSATQPAWQQHQHRVDDGLQLAKRQRMAAYLQTLAAATHPAMAAAMAGTRSRRPMRHSNLEEDAGAGTGTTPVRRSALRISIDEERRAGRGVAPVRPSVSFRVKTASVGVQTEESALSTLALLRQGSATAGAAQAAAGPAPTGPPASYASWRLPAPPTPGAQSASAAGRASIAHASSTFSADSDSGIAAEYLAAMQGAAASATEARAGAAPTQHAQHDSSGDADVAAQYLAAMQAAMRGDDGGAAQLPSVQQQGPEQTSGGGDADIAAQYMAAMGAAAAAAQGAGPPAGQQGDASQHTAAATRLEPAGGGDADIAAQYLAAMASAAAASPAGASPPAPAQQAQRGQLEQQQQSEQQTPSARFQRQRHSSLKSPSPEASPLEQLAWSQQQRSLYNSRTTQHQQSPATPLEQLAQQRELSARRVSTPGSGASLLATPSGVGLWQLATAVDVIDIEELSFGKMLGAGAEGAVYAAWFLESPVAVKKFERAEDSLHEVEMYLQAGSHDNVVALRGLCQHERSMYLVLEYCPRGTLDALLHHSAKNPWDPQKLLALVRSIARGMHYLHSRNILHRDLKPANIFVGHGQMMKIGDFGMARIVAPNSGEAGRGGPPHLRRLTPGTLGTLQYCAPELINEDLRPQGALDGEWAQKLDVWSFGVTLWEVLERRRPFEGLSQHAVQAQWMSDPYAARLPPVRLPEHLDRGGKRIFRGLSDLVEDCSRLDPYSRPSFRDVLLRLKSLAAFAERGREVV